MPKRFVVISHGPDQDKLKLALGYALQMAKQFSTKLTIVVPTLRKAPNTILRHVIGQRVVDRLAKGEKIITNGVPILMRSIRTINEWEEDGVVVSLWGDGKMLEKIERCSQSQAIVVLSWIEEDVTGWQEKHNATVLSE